MTTNQIAITSPIAVGGIGGSGTRVVAQLLDLMGIFIGDTLNKHKDNMSFPRFADMEEWQLVSSPENRTIALREIEKFEEKMLRGFYKTRSQKEG